MLRRLIGAAVTASFATALSAQPAAPSFDSSASMFPAAPLVDMHYADSALVIPPTKEFLERFPSATSLPDNPLAQEMAAAIERFDGEWGELPTTALAEGSVLKPGASGERVGAVRERLGLAAGTQFDEELGSRIAAYRAAHGLAPGSNIDNELVASLNRGHAYYRNLLELNLRRFKRLPSDLGDRYVMVDLTTQTLRMVENGQTVDSMKVVIGKSETPTPIMAGVLRYSVLNPYWNVPFDLARESVAPKYLSQGNAYLKRTGFQVLDEAGNVQDPASVDWRGAANGSTQIIVRQLPGPGNGMGAAKFMFPNALGIYLHDTPSRDLFTKSERLFSAGCIRVEDYKRFGTWLYGSMPTVSGDAPEQRVDVPDPVPVYVAYFTAVPSAGGFEFREDIYGRDAPRLARLESMTN